MISKLHHTTYILIFHFIPPLLWPWNNLACRSHPETLLPLKKLLGLEKHICIEMSLLSIVLIKIPLKSQISTISAETDTLSKLFHLFCTCGSLFANKGILATFILQFPLSYMYVYQNVSGSVFSAKMENFMNVNQHSPLLPDSIVAREIILP